ncbi:MULTISPECIES: YciI family protein [Streptomyces]|uniref:YciI family protein n=1 Tax=Streptomyces solicathayae TaxID=3081768 RepID=A0ABZ0LQ46_9ACTN|nr:YciI family protein [Streptomyces sp. HUAS YS2]WOX21625.1 YciI family protein [Streptomyces sp. HUAS YS2]
MKYMLLMQFSSQTLDVPQIGEWQPEEIGAHIAFMKTTNEKLAAAGELVDAQGLAMPDTARIVKAGADGSPLVTDGPFAETKEFLAGWWIVDVDTADRAIEIAAEVSAAPGPGGRPINMPIEVREVMAEPPTDL